MSDLVTDTHVYFYGGILSQWYPCKFRIDTRTYTFNCAEQFMMWNKAIMFKDYHSMGKIMDTESPKEQKALGRQVQGFNLERWHKVARNIVTAGNFAKFSQNPELKEYLLSTESKVLVEASPTDKIWGVGLAKDDPLILDSRNWNGTNWLGECLMTVRELLRSSPDMEIEHGYIIA